MADSPRSRDKRAALRRHGCLHRHPERVRDDRFVNHEFFDPEDLVQVKYEMLRRVRLDGATVRRAAADFGLSRPSFYAAQERFDEDGLEGLVPDKPGPKEGHKLTEKIVDFLERLADEEPALGSPDLAGRLRERFALEIHPRSVERALGRRRKKTLRAGDENCSPATNAPLLAAYERLREEVLALGVGASGLCGLGVFLQQGMMGWMKAASCWTATLVPSAEDPIRRPLPAGLAVPVVSLLSGMVLAHLDIEGGELRWN
jgi:transposase